MLRVRPTLRTPNVARWVELFLALGLREMTTFFAAERRGDSTLRCFAADSGRILLREAPEHGTELHFEVRDLEIFARWTIGDGTPVSMVPAPAGNTGEPVARIVAPDSVAFTALAVDPTDTSGTPKDRAGSSAFVVGNLAVLIVWNTSDLPGSEQTLLNIGAKPYASSTDGRWARYRAKHGGYIEVRAAHTSGVEFFLEYTGELEALILRLAKTHRNYQVLDETRGRTLLLRHPDGGYLPILESLGERG